MYQMSVYIDGTSSDNYKTNNPINNFKESVDLNQNFILNTQNNVKWVQPD